MLIMAMCEVVFGVVFLIVIFTLLLLVQGGKGGQREAMLVC